MTQITWAEFPDGTRELQLPDPDYAVCQGIAWGRFDCVFTPAFWAHRFWLSGGGMRKIDHKLGNTLVEEIAACLLGGFGIPAELGLAAYEKLKTAGVLEKSDQTEAGIYAILRQPLEVKGQKRRYRFAAQKANYIDKALKRLQNECPPEDEIDFRSWLSAFDGIGPKTASWITRNWRGSDRVAIIDVHIFRAGVMTGAFSPDASIDRDYVTLEERFIELAGGLGIAPSALDALIWREMRSFGLVAIRAFEDYVAEINSSELRCDHLLQASH